MPEAFEGLSNLAAAAAAVITLFTLIGLTVRGITYIAAIPQRVRNYFFRPKYILLPTAEEVAKYCAQSFDGRYPSFEELDEEFRSAYLRYYKNMQAVILSRTRILIAIFATIYSIFLEAASKRSG